MGQCFSAASDVVTESLSRPSDALSPAYPALPVDAELHTVRNVYDGDTLTLTDERRVRLLGIDTPELKQKQAFAEEAKAYTKGLCHKQEIWISFEPEYERQDQYGRLLCFVWVRHKEGGFLFVNEGIVHEGLAYAYSSKKKLHNWKKLIALQDEARVAKKGLWSVFRDSKVFKTVNGSAYHQRNCSHLSRTNNMVEILASEALAQGLHPCRTCLGD